jgi:hypothetical protein
MEILGWKAPEGGDAKSIQVFIVAAPAPFNTLAQPPAASVKPL